MKARTKSIMSCFGLTFVLLSGEISAAPANPENTVKESKPDAKEESIYKVTIQAYKDFNERTIFIVGVIVTVVAIFFGILFSKAISKIKDDLTKDAEKINNIYTKTFELLNKQAEVNLQIYKNREADIKDLMTRAENAISKILVQPRINDEVNDSRTNDVVKKAEDDSRKAQDALKAARNELQGDGGTDG